MVEFDVIELDSDQPFCLDKTLSCGQAPRWHQENGWWYGVVADSAFKVRQDGDKLHYDGVGSDFISRYFCLDFDLWKVYDRLKDDVYAKRAMQENYGLRILNQDAWECMVFQMTVNRIRTKSSTDRITRISSRLGKKLNIDGKEYFTFPKPADIVNAGLPALKSCNISYFADNIMIAANKVLENPLWENEVNNADYDAAVSILSGFKGIKHRVAEWILLFAFKRYEAFPVDAHIRKIFEENYLKGHYFGTDTDDKFDEAVKDAASRKFGDYRGYALEYLFNTYRSQ
ncbi:N-glycosylase/DNA lyase [Methanomicrobium sp. W14]|uniref:DNA-3-methyladenine glycosylase family protein n=1 Tax=Methanomicrobium sp. W14 TaxID=2817839 RepID=UPI001AEB2215|nr:DNA glycosylase [Methanomicrobium sp. W14]MBP2132883.1 N-glycosylase/DNA lyase [Methanomicrobium sp. W14]